MATPRAFPAIIALLGSLTACTPEIDLEAEQAALRATDEAWAAAASQGTDAELIASFWSDDATIYPSNAPVVRGKQAILEFVTTGLETPGFHVTWQPVEVVIAPSGDFGYTTGTNEFTVPDASGSMVTISGRYVTVWRKDVDGNWKCVIDMFNNGAAEVPAAAP